jgi:putative peptidoglycan lipid II flippase
VNLIASVLLVVLADPIVRLLFERGQFDAASTERAGLALACLAPGLVAFSTVNILARGFYALGDLQTPMKISLVCLGLNVVFTFWLVQIFRQGGLGLANTITSGINVALLLYALRRKMPKLELRLFGRAVMLLLPAALLAAGTAWGLVGLWGRSVGQANLPARLGAVFVPASVAAATYLGVTWWMKVPEAHEVLGLVTRRFRRSEAP